MSTPTLCVIVDLIFSHSSSCLGGIEGMGRDRANPTPPACVGDRPAATNPAGSDGKIIRQDVVEDEDQVKNDRRATRGKLL
jgi:hypothetical protein